MSRDKPSTLHDDFYKCFDRVAQALLGRLTDAISPASLALAGVDWFLHFAASPGKQLELLHKTAHNTLRLSLILTHSIGEFQTHSPFVPALKDERFLSDDWQHFPFSLIHQSFLLMEEWWQQATTNIGGVSPHHEQVVSFVARQLLDFFSPANFLPLNPTALKITRTQGGANLVQGMLNWLEDWERMLSPPPSSPRKTFVPGKNVAVTKGKVVYRNNLIELIQYQPTTRQVEAEPVLFVPAWIMKYYILDLSPHNSLVKYMVDQGHTVFMISWRNPTNEDRHLGMDDYLEFGVLAALEVIQTIVPDKKINAVGYCLGGTLLSITAAYLAQKGDPPLNTMTLLAAQIDFSEAGELTLFIDESQINFLENAMWAQGYLDSKQMARTFQMLRPYDLIWSRLVHDYLIGQRVQPNDLMAWSEDATRLPYLMHSQYLRHLFLNNELFEGCYKVKGQPLALSDIHTPIFSVSTEKDHISPWYSVYKINLLADIEITFVLTSGGHNAGIISEPGHKNRHYRSSLKTIEETYIDPESWFNQAVLKEGSWWPEWTEWLTAHNSGKASPPPMGTSRNKNKSLLDAPGSYVF